jgi:hypothetical protein
MVLAAAYLPASYVLRARAAAIIGMSRVAPEVREKAVAGSGLTRSMGESIGRSAALLGPLLAGPIGQLVQSLGI